MINLHAGTTGAPLPDEERVIRLLNASKDGKALETHFALTDKDKSSALQSLSVWAEKLTTREQALEFMGESKVKYNLCCRLSVEKVRSLTTSDLPTPVLDVVWDTLYIGSTPNSSPGAKGHAGVTGLLKPPAMEKRVYRVLRTKLADLANEDLLV